MRLSVAERVFRMQREIDSLSVSLARSDAELVRIAQLDEQNLAEIRVMEADVALYACNRQDRNRVTHYDDRKEAA